MFKISNLSMLYFGVKLWMERNVQHHVYSIHEATLLLKYTGTLKCAVNAKRSASYMHSA